VFQVFSLEKWGKELGHERHESDVTLYLLQVEKKELQELKKYETNSTMLKINLSDLEVQTKGNRKRGKGRGGVTSKQETECKKRKKSKKKSFGGKNSRRPVRVNSLVEPKSTLKGVKGRAKHGLKRVRGIRSKI